MNNKCQMAVFSNKAYNAIIRESFDKDPAETGGILLGHILNNGIWIVMDVLPPGIHSIFERAYFEYDDEFVNYLAQSVANQYKIPLELLGLWHRHPGSMDFFSSTDDQTNFTFASQNPYGVISGLVNIDPNFRLTMYHMDHNPRIASNRPLYETIPIEVGDDIIPQEYFQLKYYSSEESGLHPQLDRKTRLAKQTCVSSSTPSHTPSSRTVPQKGMNTENKFEDVVLSIIRFFRRYWLLLILLLLFLLGCPAKQSLKQIKYKPGVWVIEKNKNETDTLDVSVGKRIPLFQYLPKRYSNKAISWTSSDSSVFVEGDTAVCVHAGSSIISFKVDGKKAKRNKLLEIRVAEYSFSINKTNSILLVGQCDTLFVTSSCVKAKWKSSDKSIASVNQSGVVYAKSAGDCIISCEIDDLVQECLIHVEIESDNMESTMDSTIVNENAQLNTIEV